MRAPSEYREIIAQVAPKYNLDPLLVEAICWQESSYNTWACRFEPQFYAHYIKGTKLDDNKPRATSFGLMQVMGQTAIEQGRFEKFLTFLCDPHYGIEWGCKVLASKFNLAKKKGWGEPQLTRQALLHYNGGTRKEYADEVLEKYAKLKATPHAQ